MGEYVGKGVKVGIGLIIAIREPHSSDFYLPFHSISFIVPSPTHRYTTIVDFTRETLRVAKLLLTLATLPTVGRRWVFLRQAARLKSMVGEQDGIFEMRLDDTEHLSCPSNNSLDKQSIERF